MLLIIIIPIISHGLFHHSYKKTLKDNKIIVFYLVIGCALFPLTITGMIIIKIIYELYKKINKLVLKYGKD